MQKWIFVAACLVFAGVCCLQNHSWKILVGGEGKKANLSTALGFLADLLLAVG